MNLTSETFGRGGQFWLKRLCNPEDDLLFRIRGKTCSKGVERYHEKYHEGRCMQGRKRNHASLVGETADSDPQDKKIVYKHI